MYRSELEFAVDLVAEASFLGGRVQADIVAAGDAATKQDRSPVTIADLAIQALINDQISNRFPDDALLAEEEAGVLTDDPELSERVLQLVRTNQPEQTLAGLATALDHGGRDRAARRWVLDPIDGTKGFLRGDQYAVALALVVDGVPVVGVLGCPNLPGRQGSVEDNRGCIFAAERGRGLTARTLNDTDEWPVTVDDIADPAEAIVCESVEAAHAAHSDQAEIARKLGITKPPVRIDSQCKYALVARGDASIYLRLPRQRDYREKAWDHAAGALVIEEAGGRVTDLGGRPLDFTQGRYLARHHGIVATSGRIHDEVLSACREVLGLA